ncbi:zinc finger domain-containing protein [Micromonospora sp. RP3T]|uniref:zinc finger domain-containing protein n=1 Tax=Micromonospora sp. RP3T TaxID=2135446 RepID=UPI000D177FC4|nr:hypothetical protein [Micromonospora sp. RP3T]PTA45717.1 hypothetical protein C8054_13885 [Micromonospora sp. RP3T]
MSAAAGPSGGRFKGFMRDVGVNVLANLVAAAVIYLIATAFGYLTAQPLVVLLAVLLVGVCILWVTAIVLSEAFPHPNVIAKRVSKPCPTCAAPVGERCVGQSGPKRGFHTARIEMTRSPIPSIAQWWWT